jgi:hypothetical protein
VGSYVGGGFLLLVSAFMLLGFVRANTLPLVPGLIAFVVAVVLPAVGGVALIARARSGGGSRLSARRDQLRRQTIESELLRLAGARGGRLTVVEVVSEMAVTADDAKAALDSLVTQEIADLAVTDSGTIVYTFHDIERALEKGSARHVLE